MSPRASNALARPAAETAHEASRQCSNANTTLTAEPLNNHDMNNPARTAAPAQLSTPSAEPLPPARLRLSDARRQLKGRLAAAFRYARIQAGLNQGDVAADLDTSKTVIGKFEADGCVDMPSVGHVAMAAHSRVCRPLGLALVREIAEPYDLVLLDRARDVHGDQHVARLASVTVEATDLPRTLAVTLADGEFSVDELRAIVKEAREAAASALEVEAWAASRLRELTRGGE
jgi:transcriptional regulator with XRE-family HTH domain